MYSRPSQLNILLGWGDNTKRLRARIKTVVLKKNFFQLKLTSVRQVEEGGSHLRIKPDLKTHDTTANDFSSKILIRNVPIILSILSFVQIVLTVIYNLSSLIANLSLFCMAVLWATTPLL